MYAVARDARPQRVDWLSVCCVVLGVSAVRRDGR